jgi:phospholipase/carboxylesterase
VQAEQTEGKALDYITVYPDGYDAAKTYPVVVALHGFGSSMYDLAGLAPALDSRGYVYLCPNAPFPVQVGGGDVGYSWYQDSRGMPGPVDPSLPSADELLDAFFVEVGEKLKIEPGKVILGGFSQGGGLTLRYGLPNAERFAGLIVLSGAPRRLDEVEGRLPRARDLPVFIAHGTRDLVVPVEEGGRAALEFLGRHGYKASYHEYEMAHEVTPGLVRDLIAWIHAVLPPLAE